MYPLSSDFARPAQLFGGWISALSLSDKTDVAGEYDELLKRAPPDNEKTGT